MSVSEASSVLGRVRVRLERFLRGEKGSECDEGGMNESVRSVRTARKGGSRVGVTSTYNPSRVSKCTQESAVR